MHEKRRLVVAGALGTLAAFMAPYMVTPARPDVSTPSVVTIHTAPNTDAGLALRMTPLPVSAPRIEAHAIEPAAEIAQAASEQAAPAPATVLPPAVVKAYHTVQPGESLFRIASRLGIGTASLASANGLTDANIIYAGQRLMVPAVDGRARWSKRGTNCQ